MFATTRHRWVALATGAAGLAPGLAYALEPPPFDGLIVRVLMWFSLVAQYNSSARACSRGPVVYVVSFTATFVFLTVRVIDRRRWA